jgi:hypothetical protein
MERPPATLEDVAASKRPCLNPTSKRKYERHSLTEVNDEKRGRVTPYLNFRDS